MISIKKEQGAKSYTIAKKPFQYKCWNNCNKSTVIPQQKQFKTMENFEQSKFHLK